MKHVAETRYIPHYKIVQYYFLVLCALKSHNNLVSRPYNFATIQHFKVIDQLIALVKRNDHFKQKMHIF